MTRKREREQAFEILYEKSFHPETEMEEILRVNIDNGLIEDNAYVNAIVTKAWDKLFDIDELIECHSIGWKVKRISKVALAALRLAICEILFFEEIPTAVSINEAVELCKKYGTQEDAPFVNGILGTLARSTGKTAPDKGGENA